jgi:Uncharacterized protein conserved in bacteria (DUF2213)
MQQQRHFILARGTTQGPPRSPLEGITAMPMRQLTFDASVRSFDADGRLRVASAAISKAQVSPYLGSEIPNGEGLGLDPDRIYYMLRDPLELARAAPTYNGVPILLKHEVVSADDPKRDIVVGSAGSNTTFDGTYLRNSLSVWDGEAIDLIESGEQKELSCGYRFTADMTPGFYKGARYQGVMRNLIANHIALVAKGRAGPDVVVGDAALKRRKVMQMAKLARDDQPDWSGLAAFLKDKLSDDDMAEVMQIMGSAAPSSDDPEKLGSVVEGMGAVEQARKETGAMGAMDHSATTAAQVYKGALKRMGVAMDGLPDTTPGRILRVIFQQHVKNRQRSGQPLIRSTPQDVAAFNARWPNAARIVGSNATSTRGVKF